MKIKALSLFLVFLLLFSILIPLSSASTSDTGDATNSSETLSTDLAVEKQMIFFLHYVNDSETAKTLPGGNSTWTYFDTTLEWNDENVTLYANGQNWEYNWYLCPSLASEFKVSEYTFRIWGNASGSSSVNLQTKIEIYRVNSTGEYLVDSENFGSVSYPINPTLKNFTKDISDTTFLPGESIRIRFMVNAGSSQAYFYYDTARANSRVEFQSNDSFRIENIRTLDNQTVPTVNFDPAATNTTMYIRTNLTDPFGTYDIKWVNLTLYDPNGTVILDNITMWKISGNPVDYRAEYNYTWNYSAYTSLHGRYNITIWAVDNNGYNWYYHFQQYNFRDYYEVAHSYFYIGKMPNYVWVKAYDDRMAPLAGVIVQATLSGSIAGENITNNSGMTNITISPGTYEIKVLWQDIYVGNLIINVTENITEDAPVIVNCSVHYPILRAVDSWGLALDGAVLYIQHPNGTQLDPMTVDDNGEIILNRAPAGNYSVVVRWRGIVVYDNVLLINSSTTYTLSCSVYHVTFHATDSDGNPLSDIGIAVFDDPTGLIMDFRQTDFKGNATMRIPAGTVRVEAYWKNLLVNSTSGIQISGDGSIDVVCEIYTVTFHAFDTHGIPVQSAQIFIKTDVDGDIIDSIVTDGSGNASSVLPNGTYYIEVLWNTVIVNSSYIVVDNSTDVINVECSIYYVTFHTVDSHGMDISNAQITVKTASSGASLGTAFTDGKGNATIRLPRTDIDIQVYWHETAVYEGTYSVTRDETYGIDCWVYYVTFHTVDSHGMDISNAQITVKTASSGASLGTAFTDGKGNATIRLPRTDTEIEVYWHSISVNTSSYSVVGDDYAEIQCSVYYLSIHVVDSEMEQVEGASIEMWDIGNNIRKTAITNTTGYAVFRLPSTEYTIEVRWMDTLVNSTDVFVDSDGMVEIHAWIYHLTFELGDSREVPVTHASLNIYFEDGTLASSEFTDENGKVAVRLPKETYVVKSYWDDVLVNTTEILVDRDATVNVQCAIYYLQIRSLDSHGIPLVDAQTLVLRNGAVKSALRTDSTGTSEHRLAIGTYDIRIFWQDTLVYEGTSELDGDMRTDASCMVYYLTVSIKDSGGNPVKNALVSVSSSRSDVLSRYTPENGTVTFRLATGKYDVSARYRGEYLLTNVDVSSSTNTTLESDMELPLTFSEYPPAIYATNLFYVLLVFLLLATLLGYILIKQKKRGKPQAASEETYPESEETQDTGKESEAMDADVLEEENGETEKLR